VTQGLLVVVNGAAGSAEDEPVDAALTALRAGADVEVAATASADDLDDVVSRLDGRSPVVIGGDGSLHAVAAALDRAGLLGAAPVGLIACGTGNDLARSLGISRDPVEGAQVVLAGRSRRLDVLREDGGLLVVNAVHTGVGATAGRHADRLKELMGAAAYPVGAAIAGAAETGWLLRVEVDGRPVAIGEQAADGDLRLLMVGVCNGPTVGGGTALVPGADPGDGLLDVMVSAATGPAERLAFGAALRAGEHGDRDDVALVRGREVTITGEAVEIDADGEVQLDWTSQRWRVDPGAWSLLVPPDGHFVHEPSDG
jgi:diacylglycerol kinase family enzyme